MQIKHLQTEEVDDESTHEKIMIVDDQSYNIMSLTLILGKHFNLSKAVYNHIACNGKEAVQLVKDDIKNTGRNNFKLIFMDC